MDIIKLLPDAVANQIAAGEVIQRPASAVKELLENAVDAGSTSIKLIVKDSGRTLLQVMDNGCGMSPMDARMAFERHATSKIKSADDLFKIRTKGFRGEALASIAAVAQVELKTRQTGDEMGTLIIIEGSEVKQQEVVSCSPGSSFAIKNLFFNIPARRNFLKSNAVEMKHVFDEFQRVVLAHPDVAFTLHHNESEIFNLPAAPLAQRIVGVFGKNYREQLVQVEESTTLLNIKGFVGKPEFAKRTRGEQFLFINQRFAKDPYLNHAILSAYEEMLPAGSFPFFALFVDIDPSKIDVNIHPAKTEIKFEDERSVYAIVRSAAKRGLAKYNVVPSLDFEQENSFNIPFSKQFETPKEPVIKVDTSYNPFEKVNAPSYHSTEKREQAGYSRNKINAWNGLHSGNSNLSVPPERTAPEANHEAEEAESRQVFQLNRRYIVSSLKSGMLIIDQQLAHQRVLYEKYLKNLDHGSGSSQQELFPQTLELSAGDMELLAEMEPEIRALGFDIAPFGGKSYVINGIPGDMNGIDSVKALETLLEQYKLFASQLKLQKRELLARSMATNASIKPGKSLNAEEMNSLIDQLFACGNPNVSPAGIITFQVITLEELASKFEK